MPSTKRKQNRSLQFSSIAKMKVRRNPEPSRRRPPSFFKIMIGDFSDQLLIPPAFVKHFDGVIPQELVLRIHAGRQRRVSVIKVKKKLILKTGWNLFVKDNSVDAGDFLVFQNAGKFGFDVKIFERRTGCGKDDTAVAERRSKNYVPTLVDSDHSSDESDNSSPPDCFGSTECQTLPEKFNRSIQEEKAGPEVDCITQMPLHSNVPTEIQGTRAVEAASYFISNLPFFNVVITSSYRLCLRVPKEFIKQNMKDVKGRIMLQVSNRSWPVKLNFTGIFTSGWRAFVKDNTLQNGDVCIFELIKEKKAVMKVSIFRCVG